MDSDQSESDPAGKLPEIPPPNARIEAFFVTAPHPALLSPETLLLHCDARFQRRSGPGGQHRNKTSSGVFLHHKPTDIVAEATERRSQADNRVAALLRLRYRLAVEVRTMSVLDLWAGDRLPRDPRSRLENLTDPDSRKLRIQYCGRSLKLRQTNIHKPAVLALVLDDLHAAGGQPSVVASVWSNSTTSIVGLVKSYPPAFAWVNAVRGYHGRGPLK